MTFNHCLQIGHDLAGVRARRERVDHRHGGMLGQCQQRLMRKAAYRNGIDIA